MEKNDKTKNISELLNCIYSDSKDLTLALGLIAGMVVDQKCKVSKNALWNVEALLKDLKSLVDELGQKDVFFNE